jgi:hypothetical protein
VRAAAREIGREGITDAQIAKIDERLQRTMRQLARTEKDWQSLSADQRIGRATEHALKDIEAEAARKVANAQLQVVKTAATNDRIEAMRKAWGEKTRAESLVREFDNAENAIKAIRGESMGNLMDLMDAIKSGEGASAGRRVSMFLFDADNPQMTRDLAAEVYAKGVGSTGNKVAQEGAKAWLDVIENMRGRFNNSGGDVGKVDYGYLPQPHDPARIRSVGAEKWVADMLPKLDRSRYLDETGAPLSNAEMQRMLGHIWETISTEGLNKMEPGEFHGTGARANRGLEHRELHFKDAESYLAYLGDYGRGSMYDAMSGHIGRMARDIGLIERYGPNPNAQMRLQFDLAAKADGTQVDNLTRSFGLRPQSYWDVLKGTSGSPASARLAQLGNDVRNVQTFGKLGSAVISSITDVGTYIVTTGYNRLPYWDAFANYGKVATSKATRDFLTTHGIIAESAAGDMNRWTGDNISHTWSGRLANSTMKLSLMNAWTDTLRRAFSLTMMQGLARMSKLEWGKLTEWDRTHLERAGLTEADWQSITKAELTRFGGVDHLTPEAMLSGGASNETVSKVLGLITNASEDAVINPDLATRVLASAGGLQRGTVKGELARSVMQFKSFPIAMVSRHWRRMMDAPKVGDGSAPVMANRAMYAGSMLLTTTALGAIAVQGKQIAAGKDPIDMRGEHAGKFWARAVAQGGGLSIVGDMVLNDPGNSVNDVVRGMMGTVAGPAIGTVAQGAAIGIENSWKAAKGKETHAGAETLNLVRQNAPFVNIWYAKAAIDHAGMHAIQENLSPGYLGKMQQRAAKDWGQGYWFPPGTGLPQRAPDLGKAVGQ